MTHLVPTTSDFRANGFQTITPGISQKITTSGSSQQSAAFTHGVSLIYLFATQDCFIKIGTSPVAVADGTCMFIPGGIPFGIGLYTTNEQNAVYKLAVIQSSTTGSVYFTEGL